MSENWSQGDPVQLGALMRVAPLVQEALHACAELKVSLKDLLWLVEKMAEDAEELQPLESHDAGCSLTGKRMLEALSELMGDTEETRFTSHDEEDDDEDEDEDDENENSIDYTISVKIHSQGRFPEICLKAGMTDKEDMVYFFEWLADIVEKMDC